MKKITYILLAAVTLAFSSCDMNKLPVGSLDDQTAIQSMQDVEKFANYFNLMIRSRFGGSYIYNGELQTDLFHASLGYGNRGGYLYRWEYTSETSEMESLWSSAYSNIANANYFISKINDLDKKDFTDTEKARIEVLLGHAAFIKAMNIYALTEKFCKVYDASTAKNDMGVMIVDSYEPTSDASKYPGRSSLEETFKYINDQIKIAEQKITTAGAEGSEVLTKDAVTALKARVALAMGDFATAASAASSLVDSGKYPLIDAAAADAVSQWTNLWTNDSGKECIMQMWGSFDKKSTGSSLVYGYHSLNAAGVYAPDYILESHVVDLYADTDIRSLWLDTERITVSNIQGVVTLLNKFPGNPALQDPTAKVSSYVQKIKPFRIAEQYLIAAEAYARMGGHNEDAANYLEKLATKRNPAYTLSGDLLQAIKDERLRELVGEGFRLFDLKRYGEGFTRSVAQDDEVTTTRGKDLVIEANNYRWLWPIPQAEIDSNPQIKPQQNPGYSVSAK